MQQKIKPGTVATVYRVAYRRVNRADNKGYLYRLFKTEYAARAFIEKLTTPSSELPEKFADLPDLADVYLQVVTGRWVEIDEQEERGTNFVRLSDDEREAAEQRLKFLRETGATPRRSQESVDEEIAEIERRLR